jgi:hypothetical protein
LLIKEDSDKFHYMGRLQRRGVTSPIPSFQRSTDNLFQYLLNGGDLTPAEASLLKAYAHRLSSMLEEEKAN